MSATTEKSSDAAIRPFQVGFSDAEIADLRRRIDATRWPSARRSLTIRRAFRSRLMQVLAEYWASDYDWSKCEAKLNGLPNFITEIDGLDIHFIHVRSEHEDALPLIVTHGWPGSIIEQLKIIDPLTNPTAHGASASDAFHVVIPSLPGHGFLRQADGHGMGSRPHRTRLGRADETSRMLRVRGARWRLGRGGHTGDGRARCSGATRHSFQHARHDPGRSRPGIRARRPAAGRSLGRGGACVRAAARLLPKARGLRADRVEPPANNGTDWRTPRLISPRSRSTTVTAPASPDWSERFSEAAPRATSPETTSSTTSRSIG